MKKLIFIFTFLFCTFIIVFAQSITSEIRYFEIDEYKYLIFSENKIYFIDEYENKYTIFPESSYYLGEDGYYRLKIKKNMTLYRTDELVLIGGKYFQDIFSKSNHDGTKEWSNFEENDEWDSVYFRSVKNISSSKYLTEFVNGKLIEYKPKNLYTTYGVFCKCHQYSWNSNSIPWAVRIIDEEIEPYVEIEYNSPIRVLSVLNGFVDINNLKLFKENNRPYIITVIDIENNYEFDINIPDYVYFSEISFQKETKHIKLVIKDVYRGSKYNDTCITGLVNEGGYSDKYYLNKLNNSINEYEEIPYKLYVGSYLDEVIKEIETIENTNNDFPEITINDKMESNNIKSGKNKYIAIIGGIIVLAGLMIGLFLKKRKRK